MLKEVLFTHNDLDGYGCALVYHIAHSFMKRGVDYDVIHCANNTVDDIVRVNVSSLDPSTKIIFADICCSEDLLKQFVDSGFDVYVFDHHPTNAYAKDVIGNNATIISVDENAKMQCGTSILFNYYMNMIKDYPDNKCSISISNTNIALFSKFVDTVRSYDTWEWKNTNNTDAKYLNTLLYMMKPDVFIDKYITAIRYESSEYSKNNLFNENDMSFIMSKIDMEQKIIDEFTPDKVIPINVRGYNCGLILGHVGANIGDLSYQFLNKYPDFDMICQFIINSNGLSFSFRCIRDDIDLGKNISAPIGGGGHPKAAGASIDNNIKDEIVTILTNYLNK